MVMAVLSLGNAFGQGVDTIRDMMESKGLTDVLGSLSDDEGSDDDEDRVGSDNEGEESDGTSNDNKENQCNYNNTTIDSCKVITDLSHNKVVTTLSHSCDKLVTQYNIKQ